jgi:formyltetrahydrofolate synthetase
MTANDNPLLDGADGLSGFEPMLTTEQIVDLNNRVQNLSPEAAAIVIAEAEAVIEEGGTATDVLSKVVGVLGKAIGLFAIV